MPIKTKDGNPKQTIHFGFHLIYITFKIYFSGICSRVVVRSFQKGSTEATSQRSFVV